MRGGSVYEEGRGYGQAQGGYGSPEQGGFGAQDVYPTGNRRDYVGREPGYGGYQQGPEHGRPREQGYYQSGGHESQYGRSAPRGASQHTYGQGPEPSSGAYGGAGLGAYSEGTSDIGRGFTGDYYGELRPGRGYGQAGYSQGGGYGESSEGGLWSGIKSGFREMFGREPEGRQGGGQEARGGFRGRGPKGYQRSDERITEEVCQLLCDDDYLDASEVEVAVTSGEVTLTGTVPDRPSKRRAEDLADRVSGVQNVQNNLRVNPEGQSQPGASTTEPPSSRARARSPR
jgi:hypothetical protein